MRLLFILLLVSGCSHIPQPAPIIIPTPDQQNGADRGHTIEKEHN